MKFVLIPAGRLTMGSPKHEVEISRPFYLGQFEVTQGQWRAVMRNNPSYFSQCGDDCPVEQVSWEGVQEFIRRLNKKEGTDKYRLPTKAEWEYACRAGSQSAYGFGSDAGRLGEYAWYEGNSGGKTHPVGQKKANSWGLHDMLGNADEWTQGRVLCGGWYSTPGGLGCTCPSTMALPGNLPLLYFVPPGYYYYVSYYGIGFRLVRTPME